MELTVKVDRIHLFSFLVAIIIVSGIAFAVALDTSQPYHPVNQIDFSENLLDQDIKIGRGGLCVDSDGSCSPPGDGGIRVGPAGIDGSDSADEEVRINDELVINDYINKTTWEETKFTLGQSYCGGDACYPNWQTAHKFCRDFGYIYASHFGSGSDCCGWCKRWVGNDFYRWDCGSGGDQSWITDLYCVR